MSMPYSSISELIDSSTKHELDIEQKIVEELLTDKNIETKTELIQPIKWSILSIISSFTNSKGLTISSKILEEFKITTFKYLISKDRKGRLEYIQALQSIKEKQQQLENNGMSMKVDK